ncbi:MAG: carboxypeptidase regulatory-like domain-containing protein [Sulfurovum sp.]|nr:carboxypeptidase regulatory-like domain-containing protein [Sulfurovum sp.]
MKKTVSYLTFFMGMLFIFSGCVQRELIIDKQSVTNNDENTWAEQTNEEDNVDTSDLDDEYSDTETQTDITEEVIPKKMARIPFPTHEYTQLARTGKGTVKGSIFVNNSLGERIVGKNTRLYLNPLTSYSEQWYNESYLDGNKMEKADSRLFNYLRFTASNSNGEFAFYGVPSGSYYLIGTVKCALECGYETAKSIRIAVHVTVNGNQVIVKDLSRQVD